MYEPPLAAIKNALERDVEITVGTPEGLTAMRVLAPAERGRVRIQLKLDTGMSRQGLRVHGLDRYEADIRALAGQVKGVWTHFADGADRIGTNAQLELFDQAIAWLRGLGIDAERHTSGSAAILAGLGTAYEMVRPGLALYGLTPAEWNDRGLALPAKLTPVMSVRARAVRLEHLPSGTRVGYGGTFEVAQPAWIALLPVGYADGWRRTLGNGRSFALHSGEKVPVVGRISMDSCTLDVTSLAGIASLGRDSVFTLVGADGDARITIEELARVSGTIPQEVVLGFDDRLPMVYLAEPARVDVTAIPPRVSDRPVATPSRVRYRRDAPGQ